MCYLHKHELKQSSSALQCNLASSISCQPWHYLHFSMKDSSSIMQQSSAFIHPHINDLMCYPILHIHHGQSCLCIQRQSITYAHIIVNVYLSFICFCCMPDFLIHTVYSLLYICTVCRFDEWACLFVGLNMHPAFSFLYLFAFIYLYMHIGVQM